MIKKTLKNLKRAPVRAFAVLLFAAVISMIICALHASNEAELRNYEEVWQSVPITVTVTDPKGVNDGKLLIDSWVLDLFERDEPIKFMMHLITKIMMIRGIFLSQKFLLNYLCVNM